MTSRQRRESLSYLNNVAPVPIELDDDGEAQHRYDENSHITDVFVGDHLEVAGEGAPLYTVWAIRIVINEAAHSLILLYKRYSDIEKFRELLVQTFPGEEVPQLPPKDSFSLSRLWMSEQWLETRRRGLQWFMTSVLLNPKFQHSDVVTKFVLDIS